MVGGGNEVEGEEEGMSLRMSVCEWVLVESGAKEVEEGRATREVGKRARPAAGAAAGAGAVVVVLSFCS
jgi:hypothetical protein